MNFDINAMLGKNYNVGKKYEKISNGIKNIINKEAITEIKETTMYKYAKEILVDMTEEQVLALCFILITTEDKEKAEYLLGTINFFINILNHIQEANLNG